MSHVYLLSTDSAPPYHLPKTNANIKIASLLEMRLKAHNPSFSSSLRRLVEI